MIVAFHRGRMLPAAADARDPAMSSKSCFPLATGAGRAYGDRVRHIVLAVAVAALLWTGPVHAAAQQDVEILNPGVEQKVEILNPDAEQQVRVVDASGVQQGISSGETSEAAKVAGTVGKGIFGVLAVAIAIGSSLASLLLL